MSKKGNNDIRNKAKGVIDGLKSENESKEEKSKRVKEQKSKGSKEEKKKRSFMLTNSQIEKIYLLKAKNNDKNLSEIVGKAVEEYYFKQKKGNKK